MPIRSQFGFFSIKKLREPDLRGLAFEVGYRDPERRTQRVDRWPVAARPLRARAEARDASLPEHTLAQRNLQY